jgi:DNA-binding NarL/FixJ family response regulator
MIHLVIVDDHPAVRAGIEALLGAEHGITVAAAVATAAEAEAACERSRPDVVVADHRLPHRDGLSLCLRLGSSGGPPVVLYSAFADDDLTVPAMVAGAHAIVSKAADPHELIVAVLATARGRRRLPAPTAAALHAAGALLDPDDLPVLGMLAHGVPPAEIAATLEIGEDRLTARRRAMSERLRGGTARRTPRLRGARARERGAARRVRAK